MSPCEFRSEQGIPSSGSHQRPCDTQPGPHSASLSPPAERTARPRRHTPPEQGSPQARPFGGPANTTPGHAPLFPTAHERNRAAASGRRAAAVPLALRVGKHAWWRRLSLPGGPGAPRPRGTAQQRRCVGTAGSAPQPSERGAELRPPPETPGSRRGVVRGCAGMGPRVCCALAVCFRLCPHFSLLFPPPATRA